MVCSGVLHPGPPFKTMALIAPHLGMMDTEGSEMRPSPGIVLSGQEPLHLTSCLRP